MSIFNRGIKITTSNRSLSFIIQGFMEGDFELNPEYQREYVWGKEQQQELMSSIFLGLPIGSLAVIQKPVGKSGAFIEIVDGKQRMTTIWNYFNNEFPYICHDTGNEIYFRDLSAPDQRMFKNSITIGVNSLEANISLLDKYRYFYSVNFAGIEQSTEHKKFIENKIKELMKDA